IKGCSMLHSRFANLNEINSGRRLFQQYIDNQFHGNWIGEPSSVMIKKACFQRLGLFNERIYQNCDVEMWLRIMFFYDFGFVEEKLSAFRFHLDSASHENIRNPRNQLDQLRILEGLLRYDEIKLAHP